MADSLVTNGNVARSNGRAAACAQPSVAAELQVLRNALAAGCVSFHYVAHAWFRLGDCELGASERDAFAELFPQLTHVFAESRGGVISSYFCHNIRVAAVLTDIERAAHSSDSLPRLSSADVGGESGTRVVVVDGDGATPSGDGGGWLRRLIARCRGVSEEATGSAIHLEPTHGQPNDWKAKELLFRCMDLHYRALQFLTPKPRKICMRMVFAIIVALLGTLDRPPETRRERTFSSNLRAVESLEAELEQARRYYDRSAQSQAQYEYFVGMVGGLLLLLAGLTLAGLATGAPMLNEPLLAAPLSGGAGAVVSVMTRMTRGQLVVNYESGCRTIRIIGVIRPLLGALFGGALYLLLAGGLVTIAQTPSDEPRLLYFYAGIAFVAGFSERFAQDVVSGTQRGPQDIAGGLNPAPPAARANPMPGVPGTR